MGSFFIEKNMDSNTALKQLQDFQSTRKGAGDYYNQAQQELGVGAAQQHANDLRGLIRNTETSLKAIPSSVAGRTSGSLVTDAQRNRLSALESQPIAQQLSEQQGSYSDEMQNYRDLLGQAGTRAGMSYQTDTDKANSLQQQYQNLFGAEQTRAAQEAAARQAAEEAKRWQQQFDYTKQSDSAKLAMARSQLATPVTFNPTVSLPQQPTAQSQQNDDAAYLGRLMQSPLDQRVGVIAGLRHGTGDRNQRLFQLGKQLGYWKF